MKSKSFISICICMFVLGIGYSKSDSMLACNATLLDSIFDMPACGDLFYFTKSKFKIVDRRNKKKWDTVVFYIQCPGDFGDSFWKKGEQYFLAYKKYDRNKDYGSVSSTSENLGKLKIVGVVYDARKVR